MGRFVWGLIIGFIVFPILGVIFLFSGYFPAAVTDPPFPFESLVAGVALHARIHRSAPKRALSSFTEADLVEGAHGYIEADCAECHGLPSYTPSHPRPDWYPPPPLLFTPDGWVTDDPVGVTYWKVRNGIRMTAMPSFEKVLTNQQMWDVAALMANADKLPPDVQAILKPAPSPASGASNASPPAAKKKGAMPAAHKH